MYDSHQLSRRAFPARVTTALLVSALALLAAPTLQAQEEQFSMSLHQRISSLTSAEEPQVVDGRVLLTFNGPTSARYVAAAFSHENFTRLHPYSLVRNEIRAPGDTDRRATSRVFALAYPIPEDVDTLEYRIVVDGLWQTDPANPRTTPGENGVLLSAFALPERPVVPASTPRVLDSGRVEFVFEPEPGLGIRTIRDQLVDLPTGRGLAVYVAGSFNNWNPFMHRMRETEPGVYRLSIPVPPGRHHYYFVVDGRRVLDPANEDRTRHADGFRVCSFRAP
jgi:hypothetical protein